MNSLRVHRVNFFEPKPKAINCLCFDDSTSSLAVSREDFSIEIWRVHQNPVLEKVIPGDAGNSIESLAWCNGRLFSAGMHGNITEYDLKSLAPKYTFAAASGCPIWCLGVNAQKTYLAAGNEDGHVVLFSIDLDGINFERKFNKQEGRILCMAWHRHGRVVVTGSLNTIRVWDVNSGLVINRMMLARTTRNVDTIVWCLTFTVDMTVISGDSRGTLSFWDANTGTLKDSITTHKSDILTLCMNKQENTLYTAGVDCKIIIHSKTAEKWHSSFRRKFHTHDIRSIQLIGDFVVSGGVDCNLVFTKYSPQTVIRCFPFSQKAYSSVSPDSSCLALTYPDHIEVWKIAESSNALEAINVESFSPNRTKLIELRAKPDERIICSSIDSSGEWLAYSSLFKLRLFHLKINSNLMPIVQKVTLPDNIPEIAKALLFTSKIANLLIYSKNEIYLVKCDAIKPEVISTLESECFDDIHLLELSANDQYLVCSNQKGNIIVYDLPSNKLHCSLPMYKYKPTLLKFTPDSENLFVAYGDRKIIEYDLKNHAYSDWSRTLDIAHFQDASFNVITGAAFCSDLLILQDEGALYVVKKTEHFAPENKRLKNSEGDAKSIVGNKLNFRMVTKYKNICALHSISDKDIVIVEVPYDHLMNCLPPPVLEKKYGT